MTKESTKKLVTILIVLLVSASMFILPYESMGLELNYIQQGVVALFVFAALMWILEPIQIWTTSVLVIGLCLLCLSNQAFKFFRTDRYDKAAVYAVMDEVAPERAAALQAVKADAIGALSGKDLDVDTVGAAVIAAVDKADATADPSLKPMLAKVKKDFAPAGTLLKKVEEVDLSDKEAALKKVGSIITSGDPVKVDVIAAINKASSLNSGAVRMQISNAYMTAASKSKDAAQAESLRKSAAALTTDSVDKKVRDMKFVNCMEYKSIMYTFADPIIILFLGGFFLAAAATKYEMDINLAKVLLKPFGTNPKFVMLGLMAVTAIFAMFMSNTATAAMMLALLGPVIVLFKPEDRGRIAFALCIPLGANIGGIGTPIGTPPNAIAVKYMAEQGLSISFAKWMMFGVPYVIVMLLVAWFLLCKMFPIQEKSIELKVGGTFRKDAKAIIVYITFAGTVLLWMLSDLLGLDSNVIAIVPIVVFSITGVITVKDLKQMSWDVLWLVAGGFALGLALSQTGLAKTLIDAIPFGEWNFLALMIGAGFICMFMSTFMSNTATAALLMPILGSVGASMVSQGAVEPSGAVALLITVGLSASLGLALPISTPPNALAYATTIKGEHLFETKHMASSGAIMSILGLTATIGMMYMLITMGFFG